ncbi:hypothetical protein ACPVPU_06590 [Sphingomonas sp. CJ99]
MIRQIVIVSSLAMLSAAAPASGQQAAAPAPQPAPATGVADIYGTALGDGWQNWSWAKTELSVELNGSTRRPILVDPQAGWQALYLHHDPFDTTPYRGISMLLHGRSVGGQKIKIVAIADNKPIDEAGHSVTLTANGWTKVVVPLDALGAGNRMIDGFWIQNATPDAIPYFYAAEIKLEQ